MSSRAAGLAGTGVGNSRPRRLTHYSSGGGCGCKMPQAWLPGILAAALAYPGAGAPPADPALRIGLEAPDDAAVYSVGAARELIVTCDFLTPVVDDPYEWGRIAATNAVSDVYAMGGRPVLALNLLCWPADLPRDLLTQVLAGGTSAITEAGGRLAGGHSIIDPVPKYGMVAVGVADPDRILRKDGGRAGDVLVLTKPLGVGVIATAIKRGQAPPEAVDAAISVMTRLNASAASVATESGLRGGTDVTGYGLIGHLREMAAAAGVEARLSPAAVPRLAGLQELIAAGCTPDGTRRTLDTALSQGWFKPGRLDHAEQLVLADAQTSGGLLLAVPPRHLAHVLRQLRLRGDDSAAAVGRLTVGEPGVIVIEQDSP